VSDAIRAGAQIRPLCVTQSSGHAEVLKNVRNGCLTRPDYVFEEEGLMSVKWTVTIDCAHPAKLAAFWNLALGYVDASPPEGFASGPEWFRAFGVPPEEWDDGAYIEDPDGSVRLFHSSRSPSPKS
jgi:hypothetical protein